MNSGLNYNLQFTSNAEKISGAVNKLDDSINKATNDAKALASGFDKGMNKVNKSLKSVNLQSFISNVQSASEGLDSLNQPGLQLSSSLADLQAITDVTDNTLKTLEMSARSNAKTFGGDAAAGVESYKLILSQLTPEISKVPDALESMGTSVSTLSKTMGGDTTAATEVLTTALNQYQVSLDDPIKASKEMSDMMNIMAAAAKEGSAELPQQKAALQQSGMAAKAAQLRFEEHAAAIQVLDKAGKKGAEGGVALRNSLAVLSTGRFLPKEVRTELAAAGVDIAILGNKSLDFTERLKPLKKILKDDALLTKLFGRENKNAALALISGIDAQDKLKQKIVGTNTAYEQAAIIMESQAEKNARLKAKVEDLKISLFNATGGALGYAKVLGSIAFDVSNLIPIFTGFATAIKFVTNAEKMMALWTGIVSGATSVWTGIQWALNAALTPIFIIPAIVIAIGLAIAWVISRTEGWGEAWKHTVEGGKLLFKTFVESTKLNFLLVVNGIMIGINKIKKGWLEFKTAVGIGDASENQKVINKINQDTEARKKAIRDQAEKVIATAKASGASFRLAAGSVKLKKATVTATEGIKTPTIPGVTSDDDTTTKQTGPKTTETNTAIATGGTKHNYITITLEQLVGVLNIRGNDFKDGAKQMQDQSTDALLRTLALATTAGS